MTLDDLLVEFLEALTASGYTHVVDWRTAQRWPTGALDALIKCGILKKTKQAKSIECYSCENHCFMEVYTVAGSDNKPDRAFILCDDSEMQEQMGRIKLPLEQLQQWRITPLQLVNVIAGLMGFKNKITATDDQTNIRIGSVDGQHGRKFLSINTIPLTLAINGHTIPIDQALYFEDDVLCLDQDGIQYYADNEPKEKKEKYTPSTTVRKTRKDITDAMYADWQRKYREYRRQHPNTKTHTDVWVSKQIAKLEIAQGRDSETIRKEMKK